MWLLPSPNFKDGFQILWRNYYSTLVHLKSNVSNKDSVHWLVEAIWFHLPPLYTGSFVSEFCSLEGKKKNNNPVSFELLYREQPVSGWGWSMSSVQLSGRAVCTCWWHHAFPAQVTTQKEHQPQSKQVRRHLKCPAVSKKRAVSPNLLDSRGSVAMFV